MKKLSIVALALAGCINLAPKYERPAAPVPQQFGGGQGAPGSGDVKNLAAADFVKEPKLREILARVVSQNRSLRKVALDVESARQVYRIQRSQMLPSIDAIVGVTAARQFIGLPGAETIRITDYTASVGLSNWEIDLFGRLKNLSEAKMQDYLAAIEQVKFARISLVAEASTAFVALAADRSRLAIAKETMDTAKKAMDLTEQLVGGGTSNKGDFWQASTVYQQARGDVAALTAAIQQDRNALELLAGGPLDDSLLPAELPQQLDWFADVPVGLSSAVLLERPDVVAAEHELMGANANIGAARAAFFPTLSLTANGGLISTALSTLFTAPTAVWTVAPSLVQPLFRGGAGTANLALARNQKLALVVAYEGAIQSAFREVADALATRGTIEEQLAAQAALVDAASKSFELAQARYKAGIDPFLTTLISERALYTAKNSLVSTQTAAFSNRITLYRVLGGGVK